MRQSVLYVRIMFGLFKWIALLLWGHFFGWTYLAPETVTKVSPLSSLIIF